MGKDKYEVSKEVFNKMTEEERWDYVFWRLFGIPIYHEDGSTTILSGPFKFEKLAEIVTKMNEKYEQHK